jgi:hypothetical protein
MFKTKTGKDLPTERAVVEDSLVPSENFKPLPKKIDVTKTQATTETMFRDPLTQEELTEKEYRKKYGVSPR